MRQDVLAIGLLWAAMPFTHLLDLGYTFFSFEVWAASALFLLLGSALAYGFGKFGLQSVLVAASLLLLVCVYFFDTSGLPFAWFVAIYVAFFVLHLRLGRQLLPIVGTFAVIFSLSNVLVLKADPFNGTGTQTPSSENQQNALLHIILDEQASPDALAHTIPSEHPALSIYEDYAKRGFHMYRTTRSAHILTRQSLSNLVSLKDDIDNLALLEPSDDHVVSFKRNPQLQQLVAQQYRVRVIQSSYLDFCANLFEIACQSYPIRDMSVFQTSGLSFATRLSIALNALSRDYMNPKSGRYIGAFKRARHAVSEPTKSFRYMSWPMKTLEAMDQLQAELQNIQPGDAFVAHLLLPHFPYILNPDCKPNEPSAWGYPVRHGREQKLEVIYRAYWDQVSCAHNRIMQILDDIADKPYVTVIIHGDHGARIFSETEDANQADGLDTFLAVKRPTALTIREPEGLSLQDIFAEEFEEFLRVRP